MLIALPHSDDNFAYETNPYSRAIPITKGILRSFSDLVKALSRACHEGEVAMEEEAPSSMAGRAIISQNESFNAN